MCRLKGWAGSERGRPARRREWRCRPAAAAARGSRLPRGSRPPSLLLRQAGAGSWGLDSRLRPSRGSSRQHRWLCRRSGCHWRCPRACSCHPSPASCWASCRATSRSTRPRRSRRSSRRHSWRAPARHRPRLPQGRSRPPPRRQQQACSGRPPRQRLGRCGSRRRWRRVQALSPSRCAFPSRPRCGCRRAAPRQDTPSSALSRRPPARRPMRQRPTPPPRWSTASLARPQGRLLRQQRLAAVARRRQSPRHHASRPQACRRCRQSGSAGFRLRRSSSSSRALEVRQASRRRLRHRCSRNRRRGSSCRLRGAPGRMPGSTGWLLSTRR